jgi:antitoxin component of MazEF toxin-antitoxin module
MVMVKKVKKQTKVGTAGGNSLRVGIPETVVDLLQLERGNLVNWIVKVESDKITVCMEKAE